MDADAEGRGIARLILFGCVLCALSIVYVLFLLFSVELFDSWPLLVLYFLHLLGFTYFVIWLIAADGRTFDNLGTASVFSTSLTMSAVSVLILSGTLHDDWSVPMLLLELLLAEVATTVAVSIRLAIWKQRHGSKG